VVVRDAQRPADVLPVHDDLAEQGERRERRGRRAVDDPLETGEGLGR
jgi:hypothetical protein